MAKSTQRINLGKPYEDYINRMIESGYYASATEVIREALRVKMKDGEEERIATIHRMVNQARQSIAEGRYHVDSEELRKSWLSEAKENALKGKPIPQDIIDDYV